MKLARIPYHPTSVIEFFDEGLTFLGAFCERPWHDRLEVLAEGPAARLWNPDGKIYAGDLQFASSDAGGPRDPTREVFPGSILTFRLAEALRPSALLLERLVLAEVAGSRPPDAAVAERLWRSQFPDTARWRLTEAFRPDYHFGLVALARCEIQAIDQHWSLHRVGVSLPLGDPDDGLARALDFAPVNPEPAAPPDWPAAEPERWSSWLKNAFEQDLEAVLAGIRERQERSLRRELDRIDNYFENYALELQVRASRSTTERATARTADRLAASKAEHSRHRSDQVMRHEISVHPHLDALLLVAEPAWRGQLEVARARRMEAVTALFVPRARRWVVLSPPHA